MSWKKTIQTIPDSGKSSWRDTISEDNKPSELESMNKGAFQGLSFGAIDEIAGGLESVGRAVGLKGLGGSFSDIELATPSLEFSKNYEEGRDKRRSVERDAQEENPYSYGTGQFAGAVATSFIPALNVAKGAGYIPTVTNAGVQGGLMSLGATESEGFQDIALDTLTGTGIGVLGGTAGYGLSKGLEKASSLISKGSVKASDALEAAAEKQSAKAMGAGTKEFKDIEAVRRFGRQGLDEGVVTPMASTEKMLSRAEAIRAKAGEGMEGVYNAIDDSGARSFNPLETAAKFDDQFSPTYRTPINKSEVNQLENTIESILARGNDNISLKDAQKLKEEIGAVAFPKGKRPIDPTPKQQMAMDAYSVVNKSIDDATSQGASKLNNPELSQLLKASKKGYSFGRQSEDLLTNKLAKEESGSGIAAQINNAVDYAQLVGAYFTGGLTLGTLATKKAGEALIQKRNQLSATGFDKLSRILSNAPQTLGKYQTALTSAAQRGTQALTATHFLLQQQDPEYRQRMQELEDSDEQD